MKKVQIGQNVSLILETGEKHTKKIADKQERTAFLDTLSSLQSKYENSKNKKVKDKLIKEAVDMFTVITKQIEKEEEKKEVIKKAVKKQITKQVEKESKKEKIYSIGVIKKLSKTLIKEELDFLVTTPYGTALKGFEEVPIPKLLIDKILEFSKKGISIKFLINFWYKCLANPNHIARTKLFDYLLGQNIIITPSGNFVTYRMVKDCGKNNVKLNGYYTDAHTYTMKYVEGTVCSIPRSECDEDGSKDCSKGLHTGNPKFIGINVQKVDKNGLGDGYNTGVVYSPSSGDTGGYGTGYTAPTPKPDHKEFDHTFGNVPIICIINPSNVVSVPNSDTRKMRSCEFYFAKVTTAEEVIALEAGDYLIYDEDYEKIELETLKTKIKEQGLVKFIDDKKLKSPELKKLESLLGSIQFKNNDNVSKDLSLEQIKSIIKNRIQ
jgi:hypothetical protein